MNYISLVSTFISILVTIVSIVIGIRTFKSADIDRALRCLEARDRLGESKGDEYFDYLTTEAKRAIFVDSIRNGVHLAGWGYPVMLLLVCAPLGYMAANLKIVIDQGITGFAAEFWTCAVGALLGCAAILIVFASWCRHILYWTKRDSDSLKEGRTRTRLYFINKPWDFLWLSFMVMIAICLLSLHSRAVGLIAYIVVLILIFVTPIGPNSGSNC